MGDERTFQRNLIAELKKMFPGCVILKNDPRYVQGIPDLLILWHSAWGALECKKDAEASRQPNQDYWVDIMDRMSFAAFIHPGNRETVLDDLQRALKPKRKPRVPSAK